MSKSTISTYIVLFALITGPLTLIAGGGWVKAKQQGYYKLNQNWVSSPDYFSRAGILSPGLRSDLYTTSIYTEQGLGGGVSFEGYLPVFVRHSFEGVVIEDSARVNLSDRTGGIGDATLGLRFKLAQEDYFALSCTFTLGIPLGKATAGDRGTLFTGDGEFDQTFRLDASLPFGTKSFSGYSTLYGGFRNRSSPFNNEVIYGMEAGISPASNRVWLIGRVVGTKALGETEEGLIASGFTSSMSFVNFMAEVAYYVDERTGISASYTGALSGDILLVAPSYSVGIYYDIK